jgi:hypothetical protein
MCSLQGQAGRLATLLDPEDRRTKILQNISMYLPDDSVSHPRRLEFEVVSSVEGTIIKWMYERQNVSVLSVCLRYCVYRVNWRVPCSD